jgi:Zn-finger nucleic acid-binding protein
MQARSCPRCGAGLDTVSVGAVKVDGCGGCGGVWFDHQELTALARTQAAQLAGLEAQFQPAAASTGTATGMGCPACGGSLRGFEFPHAPGIPLHGCEGCRGIWVDDGELQAIHARLQAMQAPATSRPPAPPAARDARQKARQAAGFIAFVECPGCRQPNPAAGAVCWACGACLQGERAFLCPRCDHPLTDRVELGLLLNACNTCGGLWLDQGELKKLIRQSPAELRRLERELGVIGSRAVTDLDREQRLFCPACHVPIHGRRYAGDSGVFINACECCQGTWVDAAELTTVAEIYAES